MRLRVLISLLLALSIGVALSAQNKKGGKKKKAADDPESNRGPAYTELNLAGRIPGNAISDSGRQSDWPVIAYASDGALWSGWVEWNDKDADRIMVRRRSAEGQWGEAFPLADGNWDHYAPALTSLPNGRMLAVWPAQTDGNFELYSAELAPASRTAKPQRLTRAPFSDFNVQSASDAKGNAIVVWQSFRAGNSDVYARWFRAGRWGAETLISSSSANDWEPAVALDAAGTAWISWDNYEHGNYDVLLRAFGGNSPGVTIPITTEPTAQFHSTVAASPDGSIWVAWDDAGINWGKDFSRSSAAPGSLGLHHSRSVGMRVYSSGKLYDPDAPLRSSFSGRMLRYAELPHLAFDGAGALVLVFRHWTYAQLTRFITSMRQGWRAAIGRSPISSATALDPIPSGLPW
jgi:hypothetical protein